MTTTMFTDNCENKTVALRSPKIGDILVSTSGYEACIAHWAKVIDVTKSSVKIVRLSSKDVYGQGCMEWVSTPNVNDESYEVETKRFKAFEDTYKVKDTSYSNFYPWGGNPINCYNYH